MVTGLLRLKIRTWAGKTKARTETSGTKAKTFMRCHWAVLTVGNCDCVLMVMQCRLKTRWMVLYQIHLAMCLQILVRTTCFMVIVDCKTAFLFVTATQCMMKMFWPTYCVTVKKWEWKDSVFFCYQVEVSCM